MTYAEHRPWQERWQAVLHALDELQRAHTGVSDGPADTQGWKHLPVTFCEACWHLKDWIKNDPAVDQSVVRGIEKWAHGTQFVRLSGDVANTSKHRTREPGQTSAWIGSVDLRFTGKTSVECRIEWRKPDGTTGNEDSLLVAKEAVAEWRLFLTANGLQEL